MASSSSSSPKWYYDVFLSFRGEDTRKNFVDHLYEALYQKGIHTFKDDEVLERGESISPELLKAIEESRFAIVVFSKNYSSSSWCLDELLKIVECRAENGQIVIPVFYDVDPSQVRKQSGVFGDAFAKHDDSDKVGKWREALVQVANISGWDIAKVENGNESKCIQKLVEELWIKLGRTFSSHGENLVGIESRVMDMELIFGMVSNDVRIIGIWGMGGIGKTTIATALFEKFRNQFDGACFVSEVRAKSEKSGQVGIEYLQKTILSEILNIKDLKVSNVCDGINMMKKRLRYKKVLVVLDDVDNIEQLKALAGNREWFYGGSIIIVTTRNKHILLCHGVDNVYEIDILNGKEAIQLFSLNAFKTNYPTKEYEELSHRIVNQAGGLPLALVVLGSFLCCRGMVEWKSAVDRLEKIPKDKILDKLRISYDGLDRVDREIYLDIACFFNGVTENSVKLVLDSFGFDSTIGISVLIERSLLVVSDGILQMHHLLQELGWLIVRQLPSISPGRRSRLWLPDDVLSVLTENTGTEAVEGIILDLPEPKDVKFSNEAFKQLPSLRLLKIHNACLSRGIEYLPNELRWLDWLGYPSKFLPSTFHASKLVGLIMCHSRIVQLWKGIKLLDNLKYLNLSHSQKLTRTPDFTGVPNLERLDLKDCTRLVEVHQSIAVLKKIKFLNLTGCRSLNSLPSSILLESLEVFFLSGCVKLKKFPEILGTMKRLSLLYLQNTAIKELPSSIEHLKGLDELNLRGCRNLTSLPDTICSLSLRFLTLSGCSKLEKLPAKLGCIECLVQLLGDRTAIRQPPSSIVLLKNLQVLSFSGCDEVTSKSCSSPFLSRIFPGRYQNSMNMVLPSVKGLCSLTTLNLSYCNLLAGGIPDDLFCLSSCLEKLNLSGNNFDSIPSSITQLSQLKTLELIGCKNLKKLPQLPLGLSHLYADDCISLEGIGDLLATHKNLWIVSLANCFNLVDTINDALWPFMLQHISTSLLQGETPYGLFSDQICSICIPGTEIPKCFKDQGIGPSISVELPPEWYNGKFLGFAICVRF